MIRRVLSAEIAHETNTFSVKPATMEAYQSRLYYRGAEVAENMAGTACEVAGHIAAAGRHGWDLVQPIAARATPSGKTPAEVWARLSGELLAACDEESFDGVILALHGAMVTEDRDDAEGDLLARLRGRIGGHVPVAITLDLHANVSDEMAEHANIIIPFRTYPHIDQFEVAAEAGDLLERAMAGEIAPRALVMRAAVLDGLNGGRTQDGPMPRLLERARRTVESEPGVLAVGLCAGFTHGDVPFAGPSVTLIGDGEDARYGDIAQGFVDAIWQTRAETTFRSMSIAEAIAAAREVPVGDGGGPLVIADYTDNPGSGAYGDSVRILEAMIEADLAHAAFGVIHDPDAVAACAAAGEGGDVTLDLGSRVDPGLYGPPLRFQGTVERLSDGVLVCDGPMLRGERRSMGPTAVLRAGGVRAIVASFNLQVTDLQSFISQGIDPRTAAVVGVKSVHHFRAAYQPIARDVVLADSGSLASEDVRKFDYKKLRRPIWPLDEI